MSWARIDDRANEHKKQLAAGTEACWLWACGLMYANRQEARDGFIPEQVLGMLYPFKAPAKLAAKLVEVRLWHRVEGGYQIHDYHRINPTKEQVEAERKAGRDRAAKSYQRRVAKKEDSSPEDSNVSSPEDNTKKHVSSGLVWSGLDRAKEEVCAGGNAIPSLDPAEPIRLPETWDPGFGVLMGTSVPEWAHALLLERYRSYHCPGQEKRTLGNWRQAYSRWACTEWQNPQRRPVRPAVDDPDERRRQAAEKRRQAELQAERDVEDANRRLGIGPNATPPSSTHATRQAVKALVRSAAE